MQIAGQQYLVVTCSLPASQQADPAALPGLIQVRAHAALFIDECFVHTS
jgi:hypothetical protein